MAESTIATGSALAKQVYDELAYRESAVNSYISRFMGEDENSIVQVKTELEKEQGETINFMLVPRLTHDGYEDGDTMEGNEQALSFYDFELTLKEYFQGVKDDGKMSRKRFMGNLEKESRNILKMWGTEKIDRLGFEALTTSPTTVFYPNSSGVITKTSTPSTAVSGLDATNSKLTMDHIMHIAAYARTGGTTANTGPADPVQRTDWPIRPVKVDGKNHVVLLVHNYALLDLKKNSDYKQAMREAEVRGKENPIFTGASAIVDGVVIHEHECMPFLTTGGGGSVPYTKGVLMGAQALCWGWGQRPELVAESFDYRRKKGFMWSIIARCAKPVFNSKDFGSVGCYFACTNVTG